MEKLEIAKIKIDGGTQARSGLNEAVVNEYRQLLVDSFHEKKEGSWVFRDPIVVFYDGTDYWLADGFHRVKACQLHGRYVAHADIKQGTRRDAILYAVGANADHGLPRSNADKRRAVMTLLEDAEWAPAPLRYFHRPLCRLR